ncbi:MAG: hypothetical protein ACOCXO_01250 [Bacteroidota bacterium]
MKTFVKHVKVHAFPNLRILLLALFLGIFTSCSVQFVSDYKKEISDEVTSLMKDIDLFYLRLMEMPVEEREYDACVSYYVDIQADLHSLYYKNKVRPLNEESTENCLIALEKWKKYKNRHKTDNTLSNANIELQNQYMQDMLYYILVAEEAKKDESKDKTDRQ